MTAERRRRDIVVLPDGRLWDRDTLAMYLRSLDKRRKERGA